MLALAERLRTDGFDAILDQYEPSPAEGWPRWTDRHIRDADHVLLVCTEAYLARITGVERPSAGLGVRWEGNLIFQHIYDAGSVNRKFIPVLLGDARPDHIPTAVRGSTHYRADDEQGYAALVRRLKGDAPPGADVAGHARPLARPRRQWRERPSGGEPADDGALVETVADMVRQTVGLGETILALTRELAEPARQRPAGHDDRAHRYELDLLNKIILELESLEAAPYSFARQLEGHVERRARGDSWDATLWRATLRTNGDLLRRVNTIERLLERRRRVTTTDFGPLRRLLVDKRLAFDRFAKLPIPRTMEDWERLRGIARAVGALSSRAKDSRSVLTASLTGSRAAW